MKYMVLMLFLTSCASYQSDYRKGCIDGYLYHLRENNPEFNKFLNEDNHLGWVQDNLDASVCIPLEHQRERQVQFLYPKGK